MAETISTKICTRCKKELQATLENFYAHPRGRFGLSPHCKPCDSARVMETRKRLDPTFEAIRSWKANNRDLHNEYAKRVRAKRKLDPDRLSAHRAYLRNQQRERRRDPKYRFIQSVRAQLGLVIRGKVKNAGLLRRLHCTRDELIAHIEKLFTSGMTWNNYGRGGWQLDHRKPCAAFDLSDPMQFEQCWSLSNLQPLWESDNAAKGARTT